MKILMASWSILPSKGGSSIIVENLARNFNASELVVLGSRKLIMEAPINRPEGHPVFHYFFSELYFFGRGNRFFAWFRRWRFEPLIAKIKQIILQENIDYVIGVYPNVEYCHAACIAARDLNIPFSSYFHNTYIENTAISSPNAETIQKEIFDNSEHIFVMSNGMSNFYKEKYKLDKFKTLIHTFNDFPQIKKKREIPGEHKKYYKLVAIGNFNESNMDATSRLVNAIKQNPKYSLSLYTHVPKLLLKKRGIDIDAINYKGFVKPDEVHRVLQDYDIVVLTHGFTGGYGVIEYQTIFPTRTIPLLLSGKPIFAHSPSGSFLNEFIIKNQCAELVEQPTQEAIWEGLERIASNTAYQEQLVEAAEKTAHQFYGPQVVKAFREILSNSQNLVDETTL